ncbi:MAG: hypothetical protein K9H49_14185 [Bacteroidales bacterium]|nr:hypothetical protein [Bacteroidales bacterium]MCF8390843.1 hypothetical protein [Bacteroidales bacterium]
MKKNKFLELSWLVIAIITLTIAVAGTFRSGFSENYRFFIFFIISISLYLLRRFSKNSD